MAKTSEELKRGVEDLCYVANQLTAFCQWPELFEKLPENVHPDVVKNALLESTLLSLRALNEFFIGKEGGHPTDVRAVNYAFARILPAPEQGDLHKYLAHISTRRGLRKEWAEVLPKKVPMVFGIVADFLDHALPKYTPEGWMDERVESTKTTYRKVSTCRLVGLT